jgi:tetratricopeptide (TPR) repeat protein
VVSLIEMTGRMTNPRLGRAVAGLALTYHAAGRHDLAVEPFDRAIALSRRTEGLFNEDQLPLLEQYSDSLIEVDRLKDAVTARRYGLRIVQRKHGPSSLQSAGALESIGRWYTKVGAYDSSRTALRRAIEIIEAAEGPSSPRLIGPLTAYADCARRQLQDPSQELLEEIDQERRAMFHDPMAPPADAYSPTAVAADAEKALELAAAIATRRPDASPTQVADVRTQLGDWYQEQKRTEKAIQQYKLAWQAANGVQLADGPLTDALFGRPVLLHYEEPEFWNRYAGRPSNEIELRNVEIDVTVTAEGLVRDPKVVNDAGDPKLATQAVRAANSARYRPRFENGEPVESPTTRLRQPFIVLLPPPPIEEGQKPPG